MQPSSFKSLEQRMARRCLDLLPDFVPDESGPSEEEQRLFYQTIEGIYKLAFDRPELFVKELHDDDAYPERFNKRSYEKPHLIAQMKRFQKAMGSLIELLYKRALNENTKTPGKRQKELLETLHIDPNAAPPPVFTWMAQKGFFRFTLCLFKDDYPYARGVYAKLLGDEAAFQALESWLIRNGYTRFDYLDQSMSMDYANLLWWDKNPPRGGSLHKVRHTGVSFGFDPYVQNPPIAGLCIPGGMKDYLFCFDKMDAPLQQFILERTKKCDNCGYCVQTDKTRTRKKAFIPIEYEGKNHALCTYYPGYNYCWSELDEQTVQQIIAFLSFMDAYKAKQSPI